MTRRPTAGILSEQDLIEQEIMSTVRWHEEHLRVQVASITAACESPIERVFAAAIVAMSDMRTTGEAIFMSGRPRTGMPTAPFDGLHIYPQVTLDGYRIDFLALYQSGDEQIVTVIELDGHDFHERTKRQASHDKKRDRHFTKKGWQVLRYTGSDIWRSPSECAREAVWTAMGLGDEA
jgi:very-short-patch-repair endonuclease